MYLKELYVTQEFLCDVIINTHKHWGNRLTTKHDKYCVNNNVDGVRTITKNWTSPYIHNLDICLREFKSKFIDRYEDYAETFVNSRLMRNQSLINTYGTHYFVINHNKWKHSYFNILIEMIEEKLHYYIPSLTIVLRKGYVGFMYVDYEDEILNKENEDAKDLELIPIYDIKYRFDYINMCSKTDFYNLIYQRTAYNSYFCA